MLPRLFKTKRFAVQAGKAWICDDELREAFTEMLNRQAESLGGGVWKKRLNANRHRSIVVAKGGRYWVYQFLYAKKDQSNISPADLIGFRKVAKTYEGPTDFEVQHLLDSKEFLEIFMNKKFKSEALESVHESASALYAIGAISKATMREFDESCLATVPDAMPAAQIKALRERNNVSQPVFARYLNTSASTVKQWEAGDKHPSGMALKLLSIVQKHGLEILA